MRADVVALPSAEHGSALSTSTIRWTVSGAADMDLCGVASKHLFPTLCHECHHLVRGWVHQGGIRPQSLLDVAVAEGLATVFERDFGGRTSAWGVYQDVAIENWFGELAAQPASTNYRPWLFHHPDGRRWVAYRVGTWLADRAISKSGASAASLAKTSTAEVIELAEL
ncbi:DUF2268 domain-containing putative Zn-dependent protease [Oleiagrimonas sp. C23AA]|uniref:DUF2268 domain-containing putative Zn-dependent protease n=1 Tax=Oleiagrimonas sp. C23AA TaxID=2719047 RepID=UPI00141FF330|nr:DUF2268 domain-containing putative Zn-dependent protease [Oleiagrimonas sp. C23AA]NII09649.1 DUF2268 domain-containing protein [Oleiagrimonas sp. C23AA]